jgi:hypothetical protein
MPIATFNVNGINGRLPSLLGWLKEAAPDCRLPRHPPGRRDRGRACALFRP